MRLSLNTRYASDSHLIDPAMTPECGEKLKTPVSRILSHTPADALPANQRGHSLSDAVPNPDLSTRINWQSATQARQPAQKAKRNPCPTRNHPWL